MARIESLLVIEKDEPAFDGKEYHLVDGSTDPDKPTKLVKVDFYRSKGDPYFYVRWHPLDTFTPEQFVAAVGRFSHTLAEHKATILEGITSNTFEIPSEVRSDLDQVEAGDPPDIERIPVNRRESLSDFFHLRTPYIMSARYGKRFMPFGERYPTPQIIVGSRNIYPQLYAEFIRRNDREDLPVEKLIELFEGVAQEIKQVRSQ